ncbi:PiggyBac transposable element-derived protein 4 [Plakobranchus ocellatus]|uniref:PiggyBac transposable element-derived protein 4 n=1 Tax=Plakobranchus ocellatus TaxID=259542 RepID=A0AAV3ZAD4_9GAST|nr:PiggyBac transposable element-derived protein 4 [Plakobranchus ocellatus]
MRKNRKNGPPKTMLPKLKKGDSTVQTLTDSRLNYIRFMDRKEVRLLTTAHTDNRVTTGKNNPVTKTPIVKFKAVHEYIQYMGAVDRSDQMVAYNAFKRCTLKWWKKAFFHLFMLGVLNAYIVQKVTAAKKMSQWIFRRELAKQLVQQLIPAALSPPLRLPEGIGHSCLFRLTARHFPQTIKAKPGAKRQNPQRDCVVCLQPGKRKQSRMECPSCDVGLHADPCFRLYHTKKDFKRAFKRQDDEIGQRKAKKGEEDEKEEDDANEEEKEEEEEEEKMKKKKIRRSFWVFIKDYGFHL